MTIEKQLSAKIAIPVEYISAISKNDLKVVKAAVDNISIMKSSSKESIKITYENEVESAISELSPKIKEQAAKMQVSPRWLSIKHLEGSLNLLEKLKLNDSVMVEDSRVIIEKEVGDEADILIADARYGFIHGLMVASVLLDKIGSPTWGNAIISIGIGGGLQTLATFIPIIFMLFIMLALLEYSGYMARAAFVMDRFMRYIGLPGKAFIPMLVGFGCTVPAITATRTLANKRDRHLTIFMVPFMSCGA